MKTMTFALVVLLTALATVGFSCINDPFTIVAPLTISQDYPINSGTPTPYSGTTVVNLTTLLESSYLGKIKVARVTDIQVSTIGTYSGSVSNGVVSINSKLLATYAGTWAQFNTPQSILGSSLVTLQQAGQTELLNILSQLKNPNTVSVSATVTGSGTPSGPDVPANSGLKVHVDIFCQVDAEISGS